MINVFLLIMGPAAAWDKIARARRGFVYITVVELLPLIFAGTALEAWGLHRHGKWQPAHQMFERFSPADILRFEVLQVITLLAMIWVSALLVHKISQTFHDRPLFLKAYTTIAYAYCPMLLAHFLDYGGSVNPAAGWLLGIGCAVWVLYQGIPRILQPDPTHAFGVYLTTNVVVIMTSGLFRLFTAMYLLGYMDLQHSWLSRRLTHLFGP
jgi:hypothetical protein